MAKSTERRDHARAHEGDLLVEVGPAAIELGTGRRAIAWRRHLRTWVMNTSSRVSPADARSSSTSLPVAPTNELPCSSSRAPGDSPISIRSAVRVAAAVDHLCPGTRKLRAGLALTRPQERILQALPAFCGAEIIGLRASWRGSVLDHLSDSRTGPERGVQSRPSRHWYGRTHLTPSFSGPSTSRNRSRPASARSWTGNATAFLPAFCGRRPRSTRNRTSPRAHRRWR